MLCALPGWAVAAPKPAPAAPEEQVVALDAAPFGLNTHLASRYPDLLTMHTPADAVAQSGAGWAREDIHWYRIEPWLGNYDWSYTDAAMRALLQRGVNVVGVLGHPPGWATPYSGDDANGFSFYPPDPDRFAAYAYAVVSRYGRYVHHWEVWNEPDNPLFWKPAPDPTAYAALLIQASAAIHRAAPDAKVLIGGVNPFSTAFLKQVADAGAWGSFDIMAIHPYVDPETPEAGNLVAAADGVRALADQLGKKPLWVTEVGWASGASDHDPAGTSTEQTQANLLTRAMLLLWRAGVERSFWYTLKDDPGNPYGLIAPGSGYTDFTHPKPAFYAFRTLSRQLAGAEFVGMRDLFTRTSVLDFETFGAWRRGDQPNGTLTASGAQAHSGHTAAQLTYSFPSSGNDYVTFRRDRAAAIPGEPYALGLWVYGDGSGHTIKVWLRDAKGEVLQFALGTVGPRGWRLIQAPIGGTAGSWNRITKNGNGRLDFPAHLDSIVLDDGDDRFIGAGTILLDDLIAISGPEAYDLQLQQGTTAIDVLWSPESLPAAITSASPSANITDRDGAERKVAVQDGKITLDLGPAPVYVRHRR
ncbi:MAG: glycosyl hydrolase [Chloroflexota bacterium]|nr:glycosyl hydrolase [Chloroflexota bacterium]